jgi:hypothetical protein
MQIFQQEYDDGIAEVIQANASISYASALEPCDSQLKTKAFKALASIEDSDLYYTQSILVSSSWNKNDDIFDKNEVWAARHSPEHKPTNLEHDESTIIGHIVSNYPITEDGILIDENTPTENLPEKFHILTGAVIYRSYTKPELRERTEALIGEIENGTKYVSMECFFKGFDYGLINKDTNEFKVLARNDNTAYLTKYLRAYGGVGEHENYRIGRVLRNITFSGKGYVNRPANPDSIIFSKDSFKFLENTNLEKNDDLLETGVNISQSNEHSENIIMNEQAETETVVADCSEATAAAEEVTNQLKAEIETLKAAHEEAISTVKAEAETEKTKMQASLTELETKLNEANETIAAYMKKEKKMVRKAALIENGFADEELDNILDKFESLSDETFAAMTDMLKMKKKKEEKMTKAEEVATSNDITEVLENVEETTEVNLAVGGEEEAPVESTRAALVDFVYNRLGKKLNKGE